MEDRQETVSKVAQRLEYNLAHMDSLEKVVYLAKLVNLLTDEQLMYFSFAVDMTPTHEQKKP